MNIWDVDIDLNNGTLGQGTHGTKMGADKLAKNTKIPQMPKNFNCPICLLNPKSLEFQ